MVRLTLDGSKRYGAKFVNAVPVQATPASGQRAFSMSPGCFRAHTLLVHVLSLSCADNDVFETATVEMSPLTPSAIQVRFLVWHGTAP